MLIAVSIAVHKILIIDAPTYSVIDRYRYH